jgi:hypothetical protein
MILKELISPSALCFTVATDASNKKIAKYPELNLKNMVSYSAENSTHVSKNQ